LAKIRHSFDLDRLRAEYAERQRRLTSSDLYSLFNRGHLFAIQQRQRVLINTIRQASLAPLAGKSILEIGCGSGGVLLEFLTFGALPDMLFGIDLLFTRIVEAHDKLPLAGISCADGQSLPFPNGHFDLVLQFTALSSILDDDIKANVAREMLRMLKPDGAVLWYDFWLNPTNKQTKGIRPQEIRHLFPGCSVTHQKITLAPPVARRIVPWGWGFAIFLESLGILNTHYLAVIRPQRQSV
jgi:SAM-dependent methyltransferase